MSAIDRVAARLRYHTGTPPGTRIDCEKAVDLLASWVVNESGQKTMLLTLLCAIAFDFGQRDGKLDDLVLLDVGAPPPKQEGRVLKVGSLVSLH